LDAPPSYHALSAVGVGQQSRSMDAPQPVAQGLVACVERDKVQMSLFDEQDLAQV